MQKPLIIFHCSACGIKLTVPADLAGIKGPCPSCHAEIQAPEATPAPPVIQAPAPLEAPAPVSPPKPTPILEKREVAVPATLQEAPKKLQAANVSKPTPVVPVATALPEKRSISRGILLAAAAITLLVSGVGLFLYIQQLGTHQQTISPPARTERTTSVQTVPLTTPAEPLVTEPVTPLITQPVEPPAPPEEPKLPMSTLEVLEKFVKAQSLAERLPIIQTQTLESELASSCLAKPFAPFSSIRIDLREPNTASQSVDYYYTVDALGSHFQTVLVRKYSNGEAKVLADPFLDTFGGRLANFSKSPISGEKTFQAIAIPMSAASDESIPVLKDKLSFKLLSHADEPQIAQAYFEKSSKIGKMLEDGTFALSYGKAKPCTITLRWNSEEDVTQPFLEATEINALGWNP